MPAQRRDGEISPTPARVALRRQAARVAPVPAPRRRTAVKLRFGDAALTTLRSTRGRATLKLALRKAAARRTLTFRLPGSRAIRLRPPPRATRPLPTRSRRLEHRTGRMGTEGAYDDLEFTLDGDQIRFTKTPLVPATASRWAASSETRSRSSRSSSPARGASGSDGLVEQSGIAVNQLVSPGSRGISYKLADTARTATTVTGKLGVSYFDSKYDIFANKIWFVNCSGSQSFEAVPAS